MHYAKQVVAAVLLAACGNLLPGATTLVAPDLTLGSNLEAPATISLGQAAPASGLDITLLSSDGNRLRFAKRQDQAGAASLVLHVTPGTRVTPEFWAQGFASSGTVTYSVKAGEEEGTGQVTLTPSSIILTGPLKAPKFVTTTRSTPTSLSLTAVRLDSGLKIAEEQYVAGGLSARVDILSSKSGIGTLTPAHVDIAGGTNTAATQFQPSGEGDDILSVSLPSGFTPAAEFASVTAAITIPHLALSGDLAIGKNLEVRGVLGLGAFPPAEGLKVTITSDDPARLLLSASASGVGSKSITVMVPAKSSSSAYYIQALTNSGTVSYKAEAPGFRSGTATVLLAPSGVVLTPIFQGPPDEAQILSKEPADGNYRFSTARSKAIKTSLVAWTVQLDPVTHKSADITVQPLRGGLKLEVPLTNSNPTVGKIKDTITISGGSDSCSTPFTPLNIGSTEIMVTTPKDFTVSANSTKVIATVVK